MVPEKIERSAEGDVEPTPTRPLLFTMKLVAVEEPIKKEGPLMPLGFTESSAAGEVVPSPRFPTVESKKN